MTTPRTIRILNIFTIIISVIAILTFIGTLLAWTYGEGKEAHRIDNLEKDFIELKNENKVIKTRLDDQFGAIQSANTKLSLLLDYFNITDSTRHH